MNNILKTFISLPISITISLILFKVLVLIFDELEGFFFDWILFFFQFMFTGLLVGYIYSNLFLFFINEKNEFNLKFILNGIRYFYIIVFCIIIINLYIYGFLRDEVLIESKLLNYNENYIKFTFIGSILGIYGYFKR